MALIKVCGTDVLVSICKYTQKTPFDLYAFKEDKHFKDLTILCKDGKVLAHKFVLAQHSEFLRKHFSQNETAETIFCPEFNAGSMRKVLDLLYSGQAVTKGNGELDEVNEIKKSFRLMFELKVGRQPRPIIYDVDDDEVEPSEDPADRSNNAQAQEGSENTIQETELHGHVQPRGRPDLPPSAKKSRRQTCVPQNDRDRQSDEAVKGRLQTLDRQINVVSSSGQSLRKRNSLKSPVRYSAELPQFFCHICKAAFSRHHDCKRHICEAHYRDRLEEWNGKGRKDCRICGQKFAGTTSLLVHVVGKHNAAGIAFPSKEQLENPGKNKCAKLRCSKCKKAFPTKLLINIHYASDHFNEQVQQQSDHCARNCKGVAQAGMVRTLHIILNHDVLIGLIPDEHLLKRKEPNINK